MVSAVFHSPLDTTPVPLAAKGKEQPARVTAAAPKVAAAQGRHARAHAPSGCHSIGAACG